MQNKKKVGGLDSTLGTDAPDRSQWKADQRRRVASRVVTRSFNPPPNSPPCRAACFPVLSLSLRGLDAAACVCTVCIRLYILYLFSPSTSLDTFLANPKSTVRKKHLAFLKEPLTQLKAQQKHFPSKKMAAT